MLSGFLLLSPSKVDEPLGLFFKKRLGRIGLPFLFWGVAYFAWRFFVNREALSLDSIVNGVLTGPYFHFWFLNLLLGLYLVTPVLRVVTAYANWKVLRYYILLWFFGTALVPLLGLVGQFSLSGNVFIISGWIGYFILGACIRQIRIQRWVLYIFVSAGFAWSIFGTYFVVGSLGEHLSQFFYDAYSFNVILASVGVFMLLSKISPSQIENRLPNANRLFRLIGQNTLGIYLFHVMVMETLQRGYLGFQISISTINPIIEIPLITVIVLLVSVGVIYILRKIPVLGRLFG